MAAHYSYLTCLASQPSPYLSLAVHGFISVVSAFVAGESAGGCLGMEGMSHLRFEVVSKLLFSGKLRRRVTYESYYVLFDDLGKRRS